MREKSGTLARRISTAGAQEMQKNSRWTLFIADRSTARKKEIHVLGVGMSAVVWSLALVFGIAGTASGQTKSSPDQTVYIRCGSLIDGKTGESRSNVTVVVKNDRIAEVKSGDVSANPPRVIDLSRETCLPGLIDTHTHVLLQGDVTAADYDEQLLKQSTEYRAILATVNVRRALEYGFTTLRDVETEGAGYADVDVKTAINNGVIPGPRMQVATRAMDVTGAYPLLGYAPNVPVPHGVQVVDGADEGRKAVREQISHGADWIKVYSDRGYKVREDGVLDDIPTFTPEELKAIVDEAHRERRKVASHAIGVHGVHNSVEAGVDTIEHGDYIADEDLKTMVAHGTYYVNTIYVGAYVAEGRAAAGAPVWVKMLSIHEDTFRRAMKAGVKIAFGTDAGGFPWTENPAKEFAYMVKWGMTPGQAIRSATSTAAELLGWSDQVGNVEPGRFADIVAVAGDPLKDITLLEHVDFVMKNGMVIKKP
jgi:imidazolonepropionase-like amidohydrolase